MFVREILEQYPSTEAVLADLPHVVETARDFSRESDVHERLSFRELDFFEDESYGEGFDVTLLFSICHMFDPGKNQTLVSRAADAMNPGGRLVIRDYVLEEDGIGPRESNLFDLHMLLATDAGRNYSVNEYREFFDTAGLKFVERRNLPGPDDLLIARKPS